MNEIERAISGSNTDGVIAYTDGSTSVRGVSLNSGCGIFITDSKNKPIWSGGLVARTDGNNFIACCCCCGCSESMSHNLDLLLRIDSTAAIGAIARGLSQSEDVFERLGVRG